MGFPGDDVSAAGVDRLAILEAVRDRLRADIDKCRDDRALPNLVLRLTDVLEQIDGLPVVGASAADQIAARRDARRAERPARRAKSS